MKLKTIKLDATLDKINVILINELEYKKTCTKIDEVNIIKFKKGLSNITVIINYQTKEVDINLKENHQYTNLLRDFFNILEFTPIHNA